MGSGSTGEMLRAAISRKCVSMWLRGIHRTTVRIVRFTTDRARSCQIRNGEIPTIARAGCRALVGAKTYRDRRDDGSERGDESAGTCSADPSVEFLVACARGPARRRVVAHRRVGRCGARRLQGRRCRRPLPANFWGPWPRRFELIGVGTERGRSTQTLETRIGDGFLRLSSGGLALGHRDPSPAAVHHAAGNHEQVQRRRNRRAQVHRLH